MHISLYILLFGFSAACTNAQGAWYYPDPNTVPVFNNVDVVNASWSVPATSSGSAHLWLWCTPNGTVSYKLEFNVSVPFDGYYLVSLNWGPDLYCHFGIAKIPTGNFRIEESDQQPIIWSPLSDPSPTTSYPDTLMTGTLSTSLPDPGPTTSTPDALITSSVGAPAASSAIASSTSSRSTLSLNTATTTATSLTSQDSSLSMITSLEPLRPSVIITPDSKNINANHSVSTAFSTSLPSTSPQPASEATHVNTLSTGAKAGIIVAAVAVVAISAINILYCIRTRIRSRKPPSEPTQTSEDKKVYNQWATELQGPEFAVEKDGPEIANREEVPELQ